MSIEQEFIWYGVAIWGEVCDITYNQQIVGYDWFEGGWTLEELMSKERLTDLSYDMYSPDTEVADLSGLEDIVMVPYEMLT